MAQQAKKKATRQARRSTTTRADTEGADDTGREASDPSSAHLTKIERERNEALRQLADAKERIKQLEEAQEQVVNRIDWVVDSLHTLKQDTP